MMSSHKNIVFIDVSSVQQNDDNSTVVMTDNSSVVMADNSNDDTIINETEKLTEPSSTILNEHETKHGENSPQTATDESYLPKTSSEQYIPTTTTTMTTENEKHDKLGESQQQQQERNGSFKFSTTAYCGNCREELNEEFIASSCRKCLKRTDGDDSNDQQQHDNTNSFNTTTTTTTTSNCPATGETQQQQQHCQSDDKLHKEQQLKQLQIQIEEDCNSGSAVLGASNPSPTKSLDYTTMMMSMGAAPSSTVGSINNERICRICLDSVDEGDLIAPCKCSGSTKYAHEACLLKWFFKSSKKTCEVCLGNVNVKPIGFKPVQEWRLPENGCDFIVYLFGLYFLIMVIFTGMITWIATQGCIAPVCVTLYTVCGVAIFYFFYCCGCVEYSRRYWKALLSVNKIWRIYGRADSLKNFKHQVKRVVGAGELQQEGGAGVIVVTQNIKTDFQQQPYVINIDVPATITPVVLGGGEGACAVNNNINNNNNNNNYHNTNIQTMGIDNVAMEVEDISDESLNGNKSTN